MVVLVAVMKVLQGRFDYAIENPESSMHAALKSNLCLLAITNRQNSSQISRNSPSRRSVSLSSDRSLRWKCLRTQGQPGGAIACDIAIACDVALRSGINISIYNHHHYIDMTLNYSRHHVRRI
jgi:hypothetical protein